jgi:hypothetical protein
VWPQPKEAGMDDAPILITVAADLILFVPLPAREAAS